MCEVVKSPTLELAPTIRESIIVDSDGVTGNDVTYQELQNVCMTDELQPSSHIVYKNTDISGATPTSASGSNAAMTSSTEVVQRASPESTTPDSSGSSSGAGDAAQSQSSSVPMLPPCRICGEKASGFHYGANTCEACKGFFRRCLNRKEQYKCVANGNCAITPGKRSVCSYCRWRRCIDVGMSKTAIKTGRYTHEKKTRDIKEVKRLQEVEKLKAEGRYTEELVDVQDAEELDKIIKHITDVHKQHTPHTPEFFAKLPQKEKEFLEQRELQQKMFGTMRPIPREEYMQIYQTTGIDVDGRREMIKHMIPCIEKSIKRFIAFAKALPGFKELPIDDQIALIKASRNESFHIWHHRAFNVEKGFAIGPDETVWTIEEIRTLCNDQDAFDEKIKNVKVLQALNLTYEETVILGCLAILSPDRIICNKNRKPVEEAQWTFTRALYRLIRQNHQNDNPVIVFANCIRVLTQERTVSVLCKAQEEKIFLDWADKLEFSPLLLEMMH